MESRFLKICVVLILIWNSTFSGNTERLPGILENIVSAIKSGNSKVFASYFSTTVEITLPGNEGTFSKLQAEMIFKDFFSKNSPVSFTVDQKGVSTGGTQFIIGTYKSSNKKYKTYILLKPIDGQMLIQQIQFEIDY
jgi:hypothetical protein